MKWTAKNIALCAVLAALALGLSTLEGLFPISLLVPLPGVKLGLANVLEGRAPEVTAHAADVVLRHGAYHIQLLQNDLIFLIHSGTSQ